jgi:transposase
MEQREHRKHSREFKLEVVRLALLGEKTKAQIARELGIRVNQIRQWRLDFEAEERTGSPLPTPCATDDVAALQRENNRLRQEVELLKKATIYFVRQLP